LTETHPPTEGRPLVLLASQSPRRAATLCELGIPVRPGPVDVDEITGARSATTVQENARRKLLAGLPLAEGEAVAVAADTIIEAGGRLLGKPDNATAAMRSLETLSGGRATAHSAVAVAAIGADAGVLAVETAEVQFRTLPPEVIQWYVATGEPMGRAAAFGIGRLGEILTASVDGGYSCVSGLPKTALLLSLARVADDRLPRWVRTLPTAIDGSNVRPRSITIHPS
jgi:septum formation protein